MQVLLERPAGIVWIDFCSCSQKNDVKQANFILNERCKARLETSCCFMHACAFISFVDILFSKPALLKDYFVMIDWPVT